MDNLLLKKDLTAVQLSMVQSELRKREKSKDLCNMHYGGFQVFLGGHRYYLGDIGYAIGMTFTLGGLGFWWLLDVFFIGSRCERKNKEIKFEIINKVKSYTSDATASAQ